MRLRRRSQRIVSGWVACLLLCGASLERPEVDEAELASHIEKLQAEALEELRAKQARVLEVGHQLLVGGADLCGDEVAALLGAAIARRMDFAPTGRRKAEVEKALGLADAVQVVAVAEGSPADRAGVRVGDLVLAVNGNSIKRTPEVFAELRKGRLAPPTLLIRREGAELSLSLPHLTGCGHGLFLQVDSHADTTPHNNRKDIVIPTGLVVFARSDDELAIAIAHQIAHQLLGTTKPRAKDEMPADRLGLFLAARAGFDVSKAIDFWSRLAAEEPQKIHSDHMHAGRYRLWHTAMALRAPRIRETAAEIQSLIAAGQPLDP